MDTLGTDSVLTSDAFSVYNNNTTWNETGNNLETKWRAALPRSRFALRPILHNAAPHQHAC